MVSSVAASLCMDGKVSGGHHVSFDAAQQKKNVIKEIDGIKFDLDLREVIDSSLYFSGTFEEDVETIINSMVKTGMCVLDIGANIGYHTFRISKLADKNGQVHAIEPTDWAFQKLLRNSKLNPELDNITFAKLGLSDSDLGTTQVQFQSSYRLNGKVQNMMEDIELVTLDTYLERENIEHVDFIKLDVDGFEGKIIQGATRSLLKMKPIILMELNPSSMLENGDDPDTTVQTLIQAGYKFETSHGHPIKDLSIYWRENINISTMILAKSSP